MIKLFVKMGSHHAVKQFNQKLKNSWVASQYLSDHLPVKMYIPTVLNCPDWKVASLIYFLFFSFLFLFACLFFICQTRYWSFKIFKTILNKGVTETFCWRRDIVLYLKQLLLHQKLPRYGHITVIPIAWQEDVRKVSQCSEGRGKSIGKL